MQLFSKKYSFLSKKDSKSPLVASFNLLTNPSGGFLALEYICAMHVDPSLVNHLANLSRLNVAPEKMEQLVQDMQDLVRFVEQLNALDTTGVLPLMHMGNSYNAFRADELGESVSNEEALSNATETSIPYFKVPKVIRK